MRSRVIVLLAALASLVAGAACSPTVDGAGSPGSGRASGPATASRPATSSLPVSTAPTGSLGAPAPSSSSSSSSPTGSPTGTAPAAGLSCATGSITAGGAPFCYPIPLGFTDYSTLTNYGEGWTYRTLVSIGTSDLIEVFAAEYDDTNLLSAGELARRFNGDQRLRVGQYGIVRAGAVSPTRVAGGRAFRQAGLFYSGVHTDTTTVYLGRTLASIQCQSKDEPERVATACAFVRSRLRLVSL